MNVSRGHVTVMVLALFILDRATKLIAVQGIVHTSWYHLFVNQDGVFSFPVSNTLAGVIAGVIVGALLMGSVVFFRRTQKCSSALILLLVGASSNLYDRVVYGGVIDFLHLGTGVFNIADIYILFALFVLVVGIDKYIVLR